MFRVEFVDTQLDIVETIEYVSTRNKAYTLGLSTLLTKNLPLFQELVDRYSNDDVGYTVDYHPDWFQFRLLVLQQNYKVAVEFWNKSPELSRYGTIWIDEEPTEKNDSGLLSRDQILDLMRY